MIKISEITTVVAIMQMMVCLGERATRDMRVSEISCVRHNMRSHYAPQTENVDT
jgi:hypothetical protein